MPGRAPSKYLDTIDESLGADRVDEILRTHLIDPEPMRSDDFHAFLRNRATQLLDAIEKAMGRPVQGRDAEDTVDAFGGPLIQPVA